MCWCNVGHYCNLYWQARVWLRLKNCTDITPPEVTLALLALQEKLCSCSQLKVTSLYCPYVSPSEKLPIWNRSNQRTGTKHSNRPLENDKRWNKRYLGRLLHMLHFKIFPFSMQFSSNTDSCYRIKEIKYACIMWIKFPIPCQIWSIFWRQFF